MVKVVPLVIKERVVPVPPLKEIQNQVVLVL